MSTEEPAPRAPRFLPEVPPLPDDAVLLHVGVHKTGTTAIQAALAAARPDLRERNVYYPGKRAAQHRAALAVAERAWGWADRGAAQYDRSNFDNMARRVRDFQGRTVISSEFFCEIKAERAAEVVEALGGDNVHVVVTLRTLGNLLPSSWQQYLKYGLATGYLKWLRNVFEDPGGSSMTPTFWRRNDHAAVVRRWCDIVGPNRMTVIVLEDLDRRAMFRTFEQLLGLLPQTLESRMDLTSNRSLTAYEAQLLLDLNRAVAADMEWWDYSRLVRRGMVLRLVEERKPDPDEARIYTPRWALEAAAELGAAAAESIRESGVRILGDVDALAQIAETGRKTGVDERRQIPVEVAVAALKAVIDTSLESPPDDVVSTRELASELWNRVKADGRARWNHRSLRSK